MLVQRGAVEPRQRPIVAREMRRHPVHDDAEAGLVQRVDKKLEIIWRAVAAGRSVKASDLITPGWIKRMFCHRQKLDMSKAHSFNVFDKRLRQFAITP